MNCEHPDPSHSGFGEAFFQRHRDHTYLLEEMLDYAEKTFLHVEKNSLHTYVYDYDEMFQEVLEARGYHKDSQYLAYDSLLLIPEIPEPDIPPGYVLQSMADENDLASRAKIFGQGFNHPDPVDWPSAATYAELQKAPDYRKDLDLYIIGPDGEYVSCCLTWYDRINRLGILEPVATHPDFRRKGLGREVVWEGIRRAADLGADKIWVGSGQEFYQALGFQKTAHSYAWRKQF